MGKSERGEDGTGRDEEEGDDDGRLFKGKNGRGTVKLETHENYDQDVQSQAVGEDLSRCSALLRTPTGIWVSPDASVKTLYDLFRLGSRLNTGPAFAARPTAGAAFEWLTYNDVLAKADTLARGLASLPGIKKGQESFIGICLKNSPLWVVIEQALFMYNRVGVTFFEDHSPENVVAMCRQLEVQILFCGRADILSEVADRKATAAPCLTHLILATEDKEELEAAKKGKSAKFLSLGDLLESGKKTAKVKDTPPAPNDIALVFYTSTTDGSAKAVALSHANFVAASANVGTLCGVKIGPKDICVSYLPLGHIYQHTVEVMMMARGVKIAYSTSNHMSSLLGDMTELKPTIFPTLPQMLNLIYEKINREASDNPLKKWSLKFAVKKKLSAQTKNRTLTNNSIWDKMMFRQQAAKLGGQVKLILTGSAAVSEEVVRFWRLVMACIIVEGYGTTETCGAVSVTNEADTTAGHVGPPAPNAQLKLINIPEMGYSACDGKGEVLVKGPTVARGYLKSPTKLDSLIDKDGWFHTGDVGEWTASGCLRLIDRMANFFKMPQGCFVAPEKLEIVYQRSKWLEQIFVTADPLKSSIVGIAVLDMEMVALCSKEELGLEVQTVRADGREVVATTQRSEVCREPKVRAAVLTELERMGRAFGLATYEIIRAIHLRPEPFTKDNNLITATGKLKRHEIRRRFATEIAALYAEIDESKGVKDSGLAKSLGSGKSTSSRKGGKGAGGRRDLA